MTGVLKKMEDFANAIAPAYSTTALIPRGLPRFSDQLLRGTLRFARRIGNAVPNIQPQNRTVLTANASVQQTVIFVQSILDGHLPGCLITINDQEVLAVTDADPTLLSITLDSELVVGYDAGSTVDLYAVPIHYYSPIDLTIPSMYVRSTSPIVTGDKIYILANQDLPMSGTEFTVTQASYISMVGTDYLTAIDLDDDLPRELSPNDTLYLRAFPGYVSPKVKIPTQSRRPLPLGPFVVDYISGRFDDGDEITEHLSLQVFDQFDHPILIDSEPPYYTESVIYYEPVVKNFPVLAVPIHPSSFLFWDIVQGKINYSNDTFVLTTDSSGVAAISVELTPEWDDTVSWMCPAKAFSGSSGSVYYRFAPGIQQLAGTVNSTGYTNLTFSLSGAANRWEIVFVGRPNNSMFLHTLSPVGQIANTLKYTLVGQVVGNNIWQSGSLMVKPYFHTVVDIEGYLDSDAMNSGAVMS